MKKVLSTLLIALIFLINSPINAIAYTRYPTLSINFTKVAYLGSNGNAYLFEDTSYEGNTLNSYDVREATYLLVEVKIKGYGYNPLIYDNGHLLLKAELIGDFSENDGARYVYRIPMSTLTTGNLTITTNNEVYPYETETDSLNVRLTGITSPNTNHAPVLNSIGNKTVYEGSLLSFTLNATDPDGNALTYTASSPLPAGATFNPSTKTFSWIPGYTQSGAYTVHFEVSDGTLKDSEDITILVNKANRPPVLDSIGNRAVDEGTLLEFILSATDPDGNALTYATSSPLPAGATFNTSTKTFSWTPDYTQSGTYSIHFEVSDGQLVDSEDITITVNNVNRPPVLDPIGNQTVDEGKSLQFALNGTDLDGNALTYTTSSPLPAGATFNPSTKTFSWIPDYTQSGNYTVHFEVSDGQLIDSEDITITVNNVNRPPALDPIGNQTVDEGKLLQFALNATDPDGDALTYTISSLLPAGATFNPLTKAFSWTPGYTQSGTYIIHFEVSDGTLKDSEDITITVNDVSPDSLLSNLISFIKDLNLPAGHENSITSSLENAINSLENGNKDAAINKIESTINKVEAMIGKTLTKDQSDVLIKKLQEVIYVTDL